MAKNRTWRIVDRGRVPISGARVKTVEVPCSKCGREAELPVLGTVLAVLGHGGMVFDNDGPNATPREIACRHCRTHFVNAEVT